MRGPEDQSERQAKFQSVKPGNGDEMVALPYGQGTVNPIVSLAHNKFVRWVLLPASFYIGGTWSSQNLSIFLKFLQHQIVELMPKSFE